MVDMYENERLDLIRHLQLSLRTIRQIMGLSAQDLGNLIGLTRQTINNLENVKSHMTASQYVSLCAVIDDFTAKKPELLPAITAVLEASVVNTSSYKGEVLNIHQGSFLKRWFLSFSENQDKKSFTLLSTNQDEMLKQLAQHYKIFVDSSSLLCNGAEQLLDKLVPHLQAAKTGIIVPLRVIESLQQLSEEDEDESEQSQSAIALLSKLQKQGVLQIRGEKNDANAYSTFISVFAKYKAAYQLFLITQDDSLAGDVLEMNEKQSMSGYPIGAASIDDEGQLRLYGVKTYESEAELPQHELEVTEQENNEADDILTGNIIKGWDSIE